MPRKTPADRAVLSIVRREIEGAGLPKWWSDLKTHGNDRQDFSEVAVWQLERLLRDAYAAGFSACAEQIGGRK